MHPCRLILCEKANHWAAALRSALAGASPKIVETRSLAACETELALSPESLVGLEATLPGAESILDFILRARRAYPRATVAGFVSSETIAMAPLLRESGAIEVISSVLDAPSLARLARRQFAFASEPELSLRELAFARMPWPAYASARQRESA
jgi:hypothetical protein